MKKLATLIICAAFTLGVTAIPHARTMTYGFAESRQITNPDPEYFGEKPTMKMFGEIMYAHRQHANNPGIFITNFKPETAVCTSTAVVRDNGLIATGWVVDYDLHVNGEKQQWSAVFLNGKLVVCKECETNRSLNNTKAISQLSSNGFSMKNAVAYYHETAGIVWVNQSEAMTPEHFDTWRNSLPKEN